MIRPLTFLEDDHGFVRLNHATCRSDYIIGYQKTQRNDIDFACWDWRGALDSRGTPVMARGPRMSQTVRVLHAAVPALNETLDTGHRVRIHRRCRTLLCVNPAHYSNRPKPTT